MASKLDQLERLEALRAQGSLTDVEFNAEKVAILNGRPSSNDAGDIDPATTDPLLDEGMRTNGDEQAGDTNGWTDWLSLRPILTVSHADRLAKLSYVVAILTVVQGIAGQSAYPAQSQMESSAQHFVTGALIVWAAMLAHKVASKHTVWAAIVLVCLSGVQFFGVLTTIGSQHLGVLISGFISVYLAVQAFRAVSAHRRLLSQ